MANAEQDRLLSHVPERILIDKVLYQAIRGKDDIPIWIDHRKPGRSTPMDWYPSVNVSSDLPKINVIPARQPFREQLLSDQDYVITEKFASKLPAVTVTKPDIHPSVFGFFKVMGACVLGFVVLSSFDRK